MKIWNKGYSVDRLVEQFTVGEDYILDRELAPYDCLGSIAHAKMLGKAGFLTGGEVKSLVTELEAIRRDALEGRFEILREQEDCHTAIEARLIERVGEAGKKIHTARSRNDQVLTALRLYYRDGLEQVRDKARNLILSVEGFVEKFGHVPMPGYTHTRKAMPSTVGMWAGSLIDSTTDNLMLLDAVYRLVDQSPLGTGAGYGIPLKIDRDMTARLMGFSRVQENPIYAQASRGKFESSILHCLSQFIADANRLSCDLILFSEPRFGYFILPDGFTTGSSIMPQKKNPDVFELLRASFHQITSYEFHVKNTAANLISGYNRDSQLTKKPVMKGLKLTLSAIEVLGHVFSGLKVDEEACRADMTEELFATQRAYDLVSQGVPFREAYQRVGKKYVKMQD